MKLSDSKVYNQSVLHENLVTGERTQELKPIDAD